MAEILMRAALLMLSFFGLCGVVGAGLKLNRFLTPYVTACGIILVLMASGMLHVLKYGAWALYMAGWLGGGLMLLRRRKPDAVLIVLAVVFAVWLGWQLGVCKSWHNDDFSHWAQAAESLVRRDAFPDASEKLIAFQSYPMGATVFIYYVTRFVGDGEGIRFVAQNFLCGLLMLTLFAHVKGRRKVMIPVTAVVAVFLYKFNRNFQELQVDWLLSYFGIAIASAILFYRNDAKKMLAAALPGIAAVTLVKSSGMFFAVVCGVIVMAVLKRSGMPKKKLMWTAAAVFGLPVIAFVLWTVHVKLSFPAALDSKHAVSASAYAANAGAKSLRMILGTVVRMALKWLRFEYVEIFAVLFAVFCWLLVRMLKKEQPQAAVSLGKYLLGCLGVFVLWLVMLYAMYIFSMPAGETHRLASYERYMSSGLLFPLGIAMIGLIACFSDESLNFSAPVRRFAAAAMAVCIVTAPLANGYGQYLACFGRWNTGYPQMRSNVIGMRDAYALEKDGSYIGFAGDTDDLRRAYNVMKYDLASADVAVISRAEDGGYRCTRLAGTEPIDGLTAWLSQRCEETDHLLVFEDSEEFESLLAAAGVSEDWTLRLP